MNVAPKQASQIHTAGRTSQPASPGTNRKIEKNTATPRSDELTDNASDQCTLEQMRSDALAEG